jgi:curved DNA-binding protein CbpA
MNNLSFRPIQQCKKDNESLNYEKITNTRDNINIYKKNDINTKDKYNKTDFLEEFTKLHNDIYFNPYEILNIDKNYTLDILKQNYRKNALIYHPDKETGDIEIFRNITQSYLYLLKKYKENIPDKQIYDLKNDFDNYVTNENNNNNILLKHDKFDINKFNKVFSENNINDIDDGYNDFMKTGSIKEKTKTYIFSDDFNINIFNKIFNEKIKKKPTSEIQLYKEPETMFQSNTGYTELGEDTITDYSSILGFNKKINYTDCKIAYSEPEQLEETKEELFNSLEDLKDYRENINYDMDSETNKKYINYLNFKNKDEENRLKRIQENDLNILRKYNNINKTLLH